MKGYNSRNGWDGSDGNGMLKMRSLGRKQTPSFRMELPASIPARSSNQTHTNFLYLAIDASLATSSLIFCA